MAFPCVVDSLVQENLSREKTPNLPYYNYKTNILNITLLEENFKTIQYYTPCGGAYISTAVLPEEAPSLGTRRHLWSPLNSMRSVQARRQLNWIGRGDTETMSYNTCVKTE